MSYRDGDIEALVRDARFIELQECLALFNPYKVLGLEEYELRHTKTLAWLLDPEGNHQLGPRFLMEFIRRALPAPASGLSAEGVRVYSEAAVKAGALCLEGGTDEPVPENDSAGHGRIDVYVEADDWAIAIEAKINAKEHGHQLSVYAAAVQARRQRTHLLFLTKEGDPAACLEDCGIWAPINWVYHVADPLEELLLTQGEGLPEPQKAFLKSYLEVLHELCETGKSRSWKLATDLLEAHTPTVKALSATATEAVSAEGRGRYRECQRALRYLSRVGTRKLARKQSIDFIVKQLDPDVYVIERSGLSVNFFPRSWRSTKAFRGASAAPLKYRVEEREKDLEFKLFFPRTADPDALALRRRLLGEMVGDSGAKYLFPRANVDRGMAAGDYKVWRKTLPVNAPAEAVLEVLLEKVVARSEALDRWLP